MALLFPPIIKKIFKVQLIAISAIITLVWQAYVRYGPQMPEVSALRKSIADSVIQEIADSLSHVQNIKKIYIFKFAGDASEYFTDNLRHQMELQGKFEVIPKSWIEKIKDDLNLPERPVSTLADALLLGIEIGADGVVFGRLLDFSQSPEGAVIHTSLRVADVHSGKTVYFNEFKKDLSATEVSLKEYRRTIKDKSLFAKIFFWVIFTALLSIIAVPLIKLVVKEESNGANFVLVISLTGISLLFAGALTGFHIQGMVDPIFLLTAFFGGGIYFIWFSGMIAKLYKEI